MCVCETVEGICVLNKTTRNLNYWDLNSLQFLFLCTNSVQFIYPFAISERQTFHTKQNPLQAIFTHRSSSYYNRDKQTVGKIMWFFFFLCRTLIELHALSIWVCNRSKNKGTPKMSEVLAIDWKFIGHNLEMGSWMVVIMRHGWLEPKQGRQEEGWSPKCLKLHGAAWTSSWIHLTLEYVLEEGNNQWKGRWQSQSSLRVYGDQGSVEKLPAERTEGQASQANQGPKKKKKKSVRHF